MVSSFLAHNNNEYISRAGLEAHGRDGTGAAARTSPGSDPKHLSPQRPTERFRIQIDFEKLRGHLSRASQRLRIDPDALHWSPLLNESEEEEEEDSIEQSSPNTSDGPFLHSLNSAFPFINFVCIQRFVFLESPQNSPPIVVKLDTKVFKWKF